ncbi:hypothetical protein SLEP1_g52682 [Rubroshorea leprosula]|uniref:Uncharacterized protein n=1 Tax=Rubroshorea leprosula TaxID=152421 RepID=A0AAV5M713_9ROSI|nr:hypothetical protein SLEP1_g52682 [Rubroshorea leprosula]
MINEKLKKAKDLVEKGIIDEVQKVLEEAEALKKLPARQEPVLDSSKYTLLMFALPIKSYRFVTFVEHFCMFMRGFWAQFYEDNFCSYIIDRRLQIILEQTSFRLYGNP